MVNVNKGVLVECDPAMKVFLLNLDETEALGCRFVLQNLDDTHLFITTEILSVLQDRVDDLMDKLSFPQQTEDRN
ncbi:DgyrCDS5448 [Dimorphilus gyrociliatus]|uniref:General transcription and DNA repair factor IIH subunit TFB5 n=1 Tax=Dimorphilus gyrociliatus TaxID=2664684 RepID=A0A7I8VMK5_9ANNE|nr:DgyrCDS5448 [Dimorphilus gyrociliatus]